ncbi:DNA (cytosine-5-)-methyltransferase [uncultured Pontibacter sp.]|uniref:DNA (cytosine-5-)-methyltransferase n=1 Tax=uncultured Pontibacter sp. TaxID=453356 RepID=UPI002639A9E0|nr:DNA (cytosine-5-)-methyltransferase [uncultured Pontibacter sp.]
MKYSDIKALFKIDISKKDDARLAAFTHYLQNYKEPAGAKFREAAARYITERAQELKLKDALTLESLLPITWDVPFPPNLRHDFTFIDLFAGVGGFRQGFQNLNGKCVFTSEWNKYAKVTYDANFGEVPFGDITEVNERDIPDHDVLIAGFPCQPFSLAGVSKKNSLGRKHGFLDQTQGTLFFDVARILQHKRPKAFLLENVKNLVSHDKRKTFQVILETLTELGYSVHFKVLDGKHYVPQHRERILIVGFDKNRFGGEEAFAFPEMPEANHSIEDILEAESEELANYTLSDKLWQYLQDYAAKHREKGNGFGFGLVNLDGIARTLSARYHKDGSEILIPQEGGLNPRRLTPRECARLQGFPDKFVIPVSNTQAYRQFGNSVVAPLMEAVAAEIVHALNTHREQQQKAQVQLSLQM